MFRSCIPGLTTVHCVPCECIFGGKRFSNIHQELNADEALQQKGGAFGMSHELVLVTCRIHGSLNNNWWPNTLFAAGRSNYQLIRVVIQIPSLIMINRLHKCLACIWTTTEARGEIIKWSRQDASFLQGYGEFPYITSATYNKYP